MKKSKMLSSDGSEFTVFFLEEEKPFKLPLIVDDAGVDIDTGKYVGGGFASKDIYCSDDTAASIEESLTTMKKAFADLGGWPKVSDLDAPAFSGPIGPKGDVGWKGEQEAYAGEMVLPEDMVRGRLYKVEGIDIVARFMGEYNDLLFKVKHHDTWFYIPMDAKVRKIGQSEVDNYLE
jgi:hypothetical protein